MNKISQAFQAIPRANFVRPEDRDMSGMDMPLPIGHGQTISQPTTVKYMLEWLDPQPNDKVLDIGSGSGWTTALIANLVGAKGQVFAVEKVPQLVKFGRDNCQRLGIKNAVFSKASQTYGLPNQAPFNRVLVSAAAEELPVELIDQLKIGGRLVIPVVNDILEITKTSNHDYQTIIHPGFVFVPLV